MVYLNYQELNICSYFHKLLAIFNVQSNQYLLHLSANLKLIIHQMICFLVFHSLDSCCSPLLDFLLSSSVLYLHLSKEVCYGLYFNFHGSIIFYFPSFLILFLKNLLFSLVLFELWRQEYSINL